MRRPRYRFDRDKAAVHSQSECFAKLPLRTGAVWAEDGGKIVSNCQVSASAFQQNSGSVFPNGRAWSHVHLRARGRRTCEVAAQARIDAVLARTLLAHERKWRRDRAVLATMDYAALRDIGFTSAPWSTDPGACDRAARRIAWSGDKRLRALFDDCGRARDASQAEIKQIRESPRPNSADISRSGTSSDRASDRGS
jgi:hypothetical protein